MAAFRFLTAGESHGQTLGATIEGVPAGLALTADDSPSTSPDGSAATGAARARRSSRIAPRSCPASGTGPTLGSPILLLVRNRDWENWTQVMASSRSTTRRPTALETAAAEGNKRATPVTRVRPGPRRPRRRPQVRLQRRPRRARARLGARDGGARRGRWRRPGVPARARHRGLVVHRRGRRRGGRSGQLHPIARRGRRLARCAARTPTPRRAMIARIDEARSAGDTVGGVFEVVVHGLPIGLGIVRPLGPAARRRARRGGHEHQHRQGRRVRARLRADPTVRLGGPRRHRGPGRGRPLGPPHEQRRRPDRWRHQRRAAGRPRRGQADLDARPAAAVGRPDHRRGGRQGPLRAKRHQRRPGGRASSREAMVLLTLAGAVLEKFGGDTIDDVRAALAHYRSRIAAAPDAPVAGGG